MKRTQKLSDQVKKHSERDTEESEEAAGEYKGDFGQVISTGSTLLDLAISGTAVKGGGLPSGIMAEVYGPSQCGKTVLLSQIAGNVQKQGGQIKFYDPEARLNQSFAALFGMQLDDNPMMPDTIAEVFGPIRKWEPEPEDKIHGIFADSLAALSTKMELENPEGDKMGGARAKQFSQECRKTCRILRQKGFLLCCSNQIRENMNAGPYEEKTSSTGGRAIGFYSSVRLQFRNPEKIKRVKKIVGKDITRIVGVKVEIAVKKNSCDKPFRTAPVTIMYDYGIDNIADSLQFLKTFTGSSVYILGQDKLDQSLEKSIAIIEEENLEDGLREEVIYLWEEIEAKFKQERKPRK